MLHNLIYGLKNPYNLLIKNIDQLQLSKYTIYDNVKESNAGMVNCGTPHTSIFKINTRLF